MMKVTISRTKKYAGNLSGILACFIFCSSLVLGTVMLSGCGEGVVSPPFDATIRNGLVGGRVLSVKNTSVKVLNNVTAKITDGDTGKETLAKIASQSTPAPLRK